MRRKPYTDIGIKRVPCWRCGEPSAQQWQVGSLNNEYKGLCDVCDIELNRVVLKFMGIKDNELRRLMFTYQYGYKLKTEDLCPPLTP